MPNPREQNPAHTPDAGKVTPSQAQPELGYEATDVKVTGVAVFLASLSAFILIFFVFCFVAGKVINNALVKHDGPPTKWNQIAVTPHKRGKSLESTAAMEQQQLQLMTQRFPTPRLQMDDGNQDLADMHQREDLLLDHYTWVDKGQGVVRVPIEQAMQMVVAKGLPVAPNASKGTSSETGAAGEVDYATKITAPLTNGFARTTYEQEEQTEDNLVGHRKGTEESVNQAPKTGVKLDMKAQAGGAQ